jgi:hypothetical protein
MSEESINAESIIGKPPVEIKNVNRTDLYGGGLEPKALIEGQVAGKDVYLMERRLDPVYEANWFAMKKAHLPVVPTLRKTEDKLIVTDVKADGSETYGKGFLSAIGERSRPDVDTHFLELTTGENLQAITQQIDTYIDRANQAGIAIPWDDPFELLVHPNGSWQLIILDLRNAKIEQSTETVTPINKEAKETFLRITRENREILLPEAAKPASSIS